MNKLEINTRKHKHIKKHQNKSTQTHEHKQKQIIKNIKIIQILEINKKIQKKEII